MELVYDTTRASLATALVGRYVQPCLRQQQPPLALSLCFLGNEARSYLHAGQTRLPVLLAAKGPEGTEARFPPLHEPVAIMRCLANQASRSAKGPTVATLLLGGETDVEQAQVSQWLSFCSENNYAIRGVSHFQKMHTHLATRTFFCGDHVTLADFAVFVSCFPWMASASQKERMLYCNLTRWFDYVQHLPGVMNAVEQLPLIDVHPPQPIAAGATAAAGVEKRPSSGDTKSARGSSAQSKENGVCQMNGDVAKNQKPGREKAAEAKKKNQSGGGSKPGGAGSSNKGSKSAADSDRPVEDVTRLRMVVGQVKKVWRHPEADKLYCEEVDIGEPGQLRHIASGLVPYMKAEELEGQKVIVLANMKPKNLRGFASHGMLVCATSRDHSKCELMRPPPDTPIGEQITFEGLQGEPDPVMNTKEGKYPFAAVQPHFYTDENRIGLYKTHRFMTNQGPVFCDSIVGGMIS